MVDRSDLEKALRGPGYGDLVTTEEDGAREYSGFLLGVSGRFVLLQSVDDWRDDGAMIVPLRWVKSFDQFEVHTDRLAILACNGVSRTGRYDWIDISDFKALFASLRGRGATVMLSDNDDVEIGDIVEVKEASVVIKAIDGGGNWLDGALDYPFEDIVSVSIESHYAEVLRAYAGGQAGKGPNRRLH
ncbi:MAG TPA: hypothetical protein VF459_14725 [Caulobacteraceae bacterium]